MIGKVHGLDHGVSIPAVGTKPPYVTGLEQLYDDRDVLDLFVRFSHGITSGKSHWVINKKATESVFRGLGVFMFYLRNKKLIESPLSHGDALPCFLVTSFKDDHSEGEHDVNIVELF